MASNQPNPYPPLSPQPNLKQDLGFSASDRAESVRRVGELACLMNDAGTITIVSLVSPYREDRDIARKRHEDQGLKFMEVFMDVPLDVVQDRDPKGLYKKVRGGGRWWWFGRGEFLHARAWCRSIGWASH